MKTLTLEQLNEIDRGDYSEGRFFVADEKLVLIRESRPNGQIHCLVEIYRAADVMSPEDVGVELLGAANFLSALDFGEDRPARDAHATKMFATLLAHHEGL